MQPIERRYRRGTTYAALALIAVWLAMTALRSPNELMESLTSYAVLAVIGAAWWIADTRLVRPWRSYARLTLAATVVWLFLRPGLDIDRTTATLLWLAIVAPLAIWTVYWERTEPREDVGR